MRSLCKSRAFMRDSMRCIGRDENNVITKSSHTGAFRVPATV